MSRVNHLALPAGSREPQVRIIEHDGPHANPIASAVPSPTGIDVHVFGGLTKREHLAAVIMGGSSEMTAEQAVNLAQDIIDEDNRRRIQEQAGGIT